MSDTDGTLILMVSLMSDTDGTLMSDNDGTLISDTDGTLMSETMTL